MFVVTRKQQHIKSPIHSGGSRKKYLGGPGPSSFGRQPRLSEITIEPISGVLPKN